MAFEKKDNSGIMFVNERKTEDRHPDRNGSAMIDGREYWVSGWIKRGAKGPFMSLAFKPKDGEQRQFGSPANLKVRPSIDDEIPFAPEWR